MALATECSGRGARAVLGKGRIGGKRSALRGTRLLA